MSILELVRGILGKIFHAKASKDVAAVAKGGGISGPYEPEVFSIYSLARRDRGKIASLIIADTCDGDRWQRTNLRSIVSLETAYMLGEVAGNDN